MRIGRAGRRAESNGSFEKFSDSFVRQAVHGRDDSLPPITRIIVAVIGYTQRRLRTIVLGEGQVPLYSRDQLQMRKGGGMDCFWGGEESGE